MSEFVVTYMKCPQCAGTTIQYTGGGATGTGPFPCTWPGCAEGSGYLAIGQTDLNPAIEDIEDKLNDVLDKCNDIKEVVDEL